eukprot:jgi/Chlat1/6008/Chrsp4S06320
MSSTKEKPVLGGVRIKTRKRNIAVPSDPSSFADAVVQIYLENIQDDKPDLENISKAIEGTDLDFSRYGDTLFEVIFTGGRMSSGGRVAEDSAIQPFAIINAPSNKESLQPYVTMVQKIIRRRPFLIKNLENMLCKLIQSLEHYQAEERNKLAVVAALVFSQKVGLPPEPIFQCMQNDAMVQKGSILQFLTAMFKAYIADTSLDELVNLLRRAKVEDNLVDFFPQAKRSPEAFAAHFQQAGLEPLVEYNRKKVFDVALKELRSAVTELVSPRRRRAACKMLTLSRTCGMLSWTLCSGKNQQQNTNLALRQVKAWGGLFGPYCTTGKLEMDLLYKLQMYCYEDAKLMKLFPDIIRLLYDMEVLSEDSISLWYRKGSNPKGRQVFVKALEPFIKWLEDAEEESGGE